MQRDGEGRLAVNSHEAVTVPGFSGKDCCLGHLENTTASSTEKAAAMVECANQATFSHFCNQKALRLLRWVIHSLTISGSIYSFPAGCQVGGTQLTRPPLFLSSLQIQQEKLLCKHFEWKTEPWLVASFPKPGFEFQEIVFSDGLILSEVT